MPAERPAEASAGSEVSESTAVVIPQKGVAASLLYLKPKGTPGDIQRCPPDYHTILPSLGEWHPTNETQCIGLAVV